MADDRTHGLISFRAKTPALVHQAALEETYAHEREIDRSLAERDFEGADRALLLRSELVRNIEAALRAGAPVEEGRHAARLVADLDSGRLRLEIR
jgi:hypothetical protein